MSQPKHYYSGCETTERDVFATIVETDTSSILTARIRVEIPSGGRKAMDAKFGAVCIARDQLIEAMTMVVLESLGFELEPLEDDVATADHKR